jgi:flagellum-specific ATP synthase
MTIPLTDQVISRLERLKGTTRYARVQSVLGLMIEVAGAAKMLSLGDRCRIETKQGTPVMGEVVGFRGETAIIMPFSVGMEGIAPGSRVLIEDATPVIYPSPEWQGRVLNALAEPIDGGGRLPLGLTPYPIKNNPPPAHTRRRVGGKLDTGVGAMNAFLTLCRGQRMGIFAGSGVGKSTLLSMLARNTAADVIVIGLVGERGREVQEFIEDNLGVEGLKKSVLVVATSDESPLMRKQAAYTTLAVAEYFRNQGGDVLCLMDSVTRFAMAQREIGLSAGEPPTTKGYTPSVFAELPRLLERAGPGRMGEGNITALFTVLVEGDDTNEPIADAVRGILDGHIVLSRAIAERGRFPAIDILSSVSRTMPACNTEEEQRIVSRARRLIRSYTDMADLIRLGAYKQGSNAEVDEAIQKWPGIETFLTQGLHTVRSLEDSYTALAAAIGE